MAEDIFNPDVTNVDENYLDQYVGEGKKFKDVAELAKAYANADKHIPELQNDLQSTREFIASKLDEIAKMREANPASSPVVEPSASNPAPAAPPKDGEEDLDTRIAKVLEERDATNRLQKNANIAQEVLIEQLGSMDAAVKAVIEKARDLGVEPSYLKETAARSPRAFFNLMGLDPDVKPTSSATPAPSSDVNPARMADTQIKPNTYSYYEQLRKSNPDLYWSPKTQQVMHKDAQENPNFFNR